MVAVDTNIIVRLLTRDDETQFKASYRLFATSKVFIPDTVILECEWVLRAAYGLKPSDIASALRHVFGMPNVTLNSAQQVANAIEWHTQGMDFADAFHLSLCETATSLKTFDSQFVKCAKGKGNCRVEKV